MELLRIARSLVRDLRPLQFCKPVAYVYNPHEYAIAPYERYIRKFGCGRRDVLFVGMNPGPWGMVQTGVPFGEIESVRAWMGIEAAVKKPAREHPARPVLGFDCPRREVSGTRLWSWAQTTFGSAERFFNRCFVLNYCPLCFMEKTGRNLTPDKLPVRVREPLFAACDRALKRAIDHFQPKWLIGIGGFARQRIESVASGGGARVGQILHPSPASPAANRNWSLRATNQLQRIGIKV